MKVIKDTVQGVAIDLAKKLLRERKDDNPFEKNTLQESMKELIQEQTGVTIEQQDELMRKNTYGLKEIILGNVPSKSNCYRIITFKSNNPEQKQGHAALAKSAVLKKYEKDFIVQCVVYKGAGIDIPFQIELWVYYPNRRADLDNSLKVVLDCLQKSVGAIRNDNLCEEIIAHRKIDAQNPRVEFVITPAIQ